MTGELCQSLPPRWRSLNIYLLSRREHALRLNVSRRRVHPSDLLLSLDMPERGLLSKIYPRKGVKYFSLFYYYYFYFLKHGHSALPIYLLIMMFIFREFLSQLLKAGFDPKIGFFKSTHERLLYPNPQVRICRRYP